MATSRSKASLRLAGCFFCMLSAVLAMVLCSQRGFITAAEQKAAETPTGIAMPRKLELLKDCLTEPVVEQVAFSKDGKLLVCRRTDVPNLTVGNAIELWDISTGKRVGELKPKLTYNALAALPHAQLCVWSDSGVEVQSDLKEPVKKTIKLKQYEKTDELDRVFFSTDEQLLAGLRRDDVSLNVWSVQSGERLGHFLIPNTRIAGIRSVTFDLAGRFVAAGIDDVHEGWLGGLIVWDLKTGRQILRTTETFRVIQVAFCVNGDLLYVGGSSDLESGVIALRSGKDFAKLVHRIEPDAGITSVAVATGNRAVTGGWNGQVLVWDLSTGAQIAKRMLPAPVISLAISRDGDILAAGSYRSGTSLLRLEKSGSVK